MKTFENHIGRLFVSITILLVFGNVAFAAEGYFEMRRGAFVSELQKEEHKPFILNEVSIGESSQIVSQNEYLGLGLFGAFYSNQDFSFARVSSLVNPSYLLKDKRELIFRHLFPFHFFW